MVERMSPAKGIAVAIVLIIMSMWSIGVAIERIFTFTQASQPVEAVCAPQVAKHLRRKRASRRTRSRSSSSKNYRYSHLAKVVLAGLQEYQFQQESGGNLSREDLLDTVRRAIQRASALTAVGPQEAASRRWRPSARRPRSSGCSARCSASSWRSRASRLVGLERPRRRGLQAGRRSEALVETALGPRRRHPGRVVLQLPDRPHRCISTLEMDNSSSELVDYFIKKTA